MLRTAILFVLLAGCPATSEPSKPPVTPSQPTPPTQPTGSGSSAEPNKPPPADAVACESDTDCNSHACGPCNAGDVLTQHDVSIKCFRNPCPKSTVSCKNKVCTVN